MKPKINKLINKLTDLGERQLQVETKAKKIIEHFLIENGVDLEIQNYTTQIPNYKSWYLKIDGKNVDCLPCGFRSGSISDNHTVLSSLISSQNNLYDTNINFNPECEAISKSNFYFAPALAIAKSDVQKIVNAHKVDGQVRVVKKYHTSANLLIGNTKKPKNIIFSHYDSVMTGAVDNASGTALSCQIAVEFPDLIKDNLIAICGNEELSYDEPIYWGHGYREFEKKYSTQLKNAKQLIILDSFGHTEPELITDIPTMTLAFPIKNIEKYAAKTKVVAGSLGKLMRFYHAESDVASNIKSKYYKSAMNKTLELLK